MPKTEEKKPVLMQDVLNEFGTSPLSAGDLEALEALQGELDNERAVALGADAAKRTLPVLVENPDGTISTQAEAKAVVESGNGVGPYDGHGRA